MGIKGFNDKPHFSERIKLISSQIEMNTLFKNDGERKRRKCDIIINKAMRIPVDIHQTNELFLLQFNQKMHVS